MTDLPFPTPDQPGTKPDPQPDNPGAPVNPVTEVTEETAQDTQDQGMYEAGTPTAIERRLIHVDRTTEETLVLVRTQQQHFLALVALIAITGALVYLQGREVRALMAVEDE